MKAKKPAPIKKKNPALWKKGQSGNPKGRPPDVLGKEMRQLTAHEFAEMANLIVKGEFDEIERIDREKDGSALRCWIAAVAVKAANAGDMDALDKLLNRLVGKVKDHVEHSGTAPAQVVRLYLPPNGREAKDP